MSKTITVSDETWGKIREQVEAEQVEAEKETTKPKGVTIYKHDGSVLFESTKETLKEAVVEGKANLCGANLREANLREANLCGANLYGANLREAEFQNAKFYGKGGTTKIKKSQVDDFFKALGVIVED